jgi:hypothetical protein
MLKSGRYQIARFLRFLRRNIKVCRLIDIQVTLPANMQEIFVEFTEFNVFEIPSRIGVITANRLSPICTPADCNRLLIREVPNRCIPVTTSTCDTTSQTGRAICRLCGNEQLPAIRRHLGKTH